MNEPITLAPPQVQPAQPRTKWECEYQAFKGLLPQLMATHRGRYVAVHNAQVVDSGDDKLGLALRVLAKIGNVPIHVGRVTDEPEAVARSGIRREPQSTGDLP